MGKIRVKTLGNDEAESAQKERAQARRETKKFLRHTQDKPKKAQVKGVGLKGGERVKVVEGLDEETLKKLEALEQKPVIYTGSAVSPGDEAKPKKKSKAAPQPKKRSKRYQEAAKLVNRTKLYPISEALELIKKTSLTRFDGSVEVHLGLDPTMLKDKPATTTVGKDKREKKKESAAVSSLRGSVVFPHGTGKTIRVAIATDEVINQIENGIINFDVLVTHPSMMPRLAKFARVLGPKGLMPNPKNNTIGDDPEALAKKFSAGHTQFKTEPDNPLLHMAIGKVSFDADTLKDNLLALIHAIGKDKVARITLSSTMGPGIKVDLTSL